MLTAYDIILLAVENYRERTRKAEYKEVEGVTVQVPNILDRAVLTLHKALTRRTHKVYQSGPQLVHGGSVAK
jgi:hypothetical protein